MASRNRAGYQYDPIPRPARDRSRDRAYATHQASDEAKAELLSKLPPGTNPRSSVADLTSAARGTNASPVSPGFRAAFGGGPPPAAWSEAFPASGGGRQVASVANPPPVTNNRGAAPVTRASDINGPGMQRLLDSNATVKPSAPSNEVQAAPGVLAAAGTNKTIQTPYGTAGSAPGWHHDVMKAHPEIGKAGTPENIAFVKSYKDAQAAGGPIDHMEIARTVTNNIKNPAPVAKMPAGIAAAESDGIKAPTTGITAGVTPSPAVAATAPKFAGAPVGATPWNPIATPGTAETAAAKTASAGIMKPPVTGSGTGFYQPAPAAPDSKDAVAHLVDSGSRAFNTPLGGNNPTPPPPSAAISSTKPPVPGAADSSSTASTFPLTDPALKKKKGNMFDGDYRMAL